MSSGINKITAERNQRTLLELAVQPGNDICADCKTRHPRWASYNLGIFICVNCASIHRKMGTHISKVKSLTLDSWSKEQVEVMKTTGNVKSNAHYNPDETRHPPPTNMIDQERDSDLEKYIRYKYEYKKFVSRSSQVAALLGPSQSASSRLAPSPSRSQTMPPSSSTTTASSSNKPAPPSVPSATPASVPAVDSLRTQSQIRSVSQPVVQSPAQTQTPFVQPRSATQPPQQQQQQQQPTNPLWNDLAQLQTPATNSSLPLQYASPVTTQPMTIPAGLTAPSPQFTGLSVSPHNPFPSQLAQQYPGGTQRSMSLNTGLTMNQGMSMGGLTPGMTGASPSMFQPQPTPGGLSTPSPFIPQNTTPSPNPFAAQSLPQTGLGIQQPFAPPAFGQPPQQQPMFSAQPQSSPLIPTQPMLSAQPQGSPMFPPQQLGQMPMQMQMQMQPQASPMFQQQAPAQPMQMGNPFLQSQPQMSMTSYGSPQPPFGQPPQQQQQMYGQSNPFGGTGWQQQGFPGQQQPWGGM